MKSQGDKQKKVEEHPHNNWETIDSYKEITGKAGNWFSGYLISHKIVYVQLCKNCGYIRKV